MAEHIFFIFYIIFFIISIVGHGEIFSRIVNKDLLNLNIGYIGILGFFSLSVYSVVSSFFFAHNFLHNIVLHLIGLIGFYYFFFKKEKMKIK